MKKALSLILAFVMMLSLSVTALAAEAEAITGTWSYNADTKTFTVDVPVKRTVNVGDPIPSITLSGTYDGFSLPVWVVTTVDSGARFANVWDYANGNFTAGKQYGYALLIQYTPYYMDGLDIRGGKIILNGKEYSDIKFPTGGTFPRSFNPQITSPITFCIVVDLGVLGEDGRFAGGDFPEDPIGDPNDKSGDTTITAVKPEPFSYEIVFPTEVAEITAAGVHKVGQAKVKNVVSATENTVISYIATTTNFKLSTDESKTMAATYYTEQAATNTFPTTAVTVYENKADAASIPTMWVKIDESVWKAAKAGTYTATVTFNFEVKEVELG